MKIGPLESKPAANTRRGTQEPAGDGASQRRAQRPGRPVARGVGAGRRGADPAFDTAKVERIAQAIRDGKFTVNAEAIADKLIVNAEELLGRKLS